MQVIEIESDSSSSPDTDSIFSISKQKNSKPMSAKPIIEVIDDEEEEESHFEE